MLDEHRNYGLAGGALPSFAPSLHGQLRQEACRRGEDARWTEAQAAVYVQLGVEQAEHHANWGA